MSSVPPTTAPTPTGSGSSGSQQRRATQHEQPQGQALAPSTGHKPAVSLSASLAPVSVGQRIEGQVIAGDPSGQMLLRTDSGTFALPPASALPPAADVLIQILSVGADLRVALVSLNGQDLHPPLQLTLELTQPVSGGNLRIPLIPASDDPVGQDAIETMLRPGGPITARLVAETQPGSTAVRSRAYGYLGVPAAASPGDAPLAAPGNLVGSLPVGTTLLLRILTVTPPINRILGATPPTSSPAGTTPLVSVAGTAPPVSAAGTAPPANGAPQTAAAPPASQTPGFVGQSDAATGQQPAGSGATGGAAAARNDGPMISGIVTGQGATPGQTLLRTSAGVLVLETDSEVPRGTLVTAQVVSRTAVQNVPSGLHALGDIHPFPPEAASLGLQLANGEWPTLKALTSVLAALDPHLVQHLTGQRLPAPGPTMASAILFFLTALRSGGFRSWIGSDSADSLERAGRSDVLKAFADDFQHAARQLHDNSSDWRAFIFPLYDGHLLHRLTLYHRHHRRPAGQDDAGENDTRFVLDLKFSRLGDMQLDGLVHGKNFDLYVRSTNPLEDQIRSNVSKIFSEAVDITGMSGGIIFQVAKHFPVSPATDNSAAARRDGMVV